MKPNTSTRVGRMMEGLLASDNENGKVLVTVEITRDGNVTAFQDTFQLRRWRGRRGDDILFVSLPDTADWTAEPPVKPVTPLSVNLRTWETRQERHDPRVDDLVRYAAHAALRFAFDGKAPQPKNGTVKIVEQAVCGRCGLPLKDAESIRRGIGPDCEEKMTGVKRKRTTRKMTSRAAQRMGQQEIG